MKVKSISKAKIRYKHAKMDAEVKGVLYEGFELEVEKVIGEAHQGNDSWYKDKNGDFYWSGDFEKVGEVLKKKLTDSLKDIEPMPEQGVEVKSVNYNQVFEGIPSAFRANKGAGVKVALIDSGVYRQHNDLRLSSDQIIDFSGDTTDGRDTNGHGTHLAGLIAGKGHNGGGVVGVAPEAELLCYKIDTVDFSAEPLKKALKNIIDAPEHVDIVNMSFSIKTAQYEQIKDELQELADRGTFLLAAARENIFLLERGKFKYLNKPARDQNVIAVGAANSEFSQNIQGRRFIDKLAYLMPMLNYTSTSIASQNYYKSEGQSSQTTALLSGLTALALSHFKVRGNYQKAEVLNELNSWAVPFQESQLSELQLLIP